MTIKIYDVVVIGAGPAGGMASLLLARRGLQVLLCEKHRFPRAKVCGGCLNAGALQLLDAASVHVPGPNLRTLTLHTCGRSVSVPLPPGRAISRERLDAIIVEAAVAAGARFQDGCEATVLPPQPPERFRRILAGGIEIGATAVVAAAGLGGKYEQHPPAWHIASGSRIGAGAIVSAAQAVPHGVVDMHWGEGGYVGLVQLDAQTVNAAAALDPLYVRRCGGLGAAIAMILQAHRHPLADIVEHAAWRGTPPLTRQPAAGAGERIFCVGDAAGYVEPFTGEGMAMALSSAALAVPFVCAVVKSQAPPRHARYESELSRHHNPRLRVCAALTSMMRHRIIRHSAMCVCSAIPAVATRIAARASTQRLVPLAAGEV